jgi:hypothetical protein
MILIPHIGAIAGNRRRASGGYDADAQAFFDAAGITDSTQKTAVNDFVVGAKGITLTVGGSFWDGLYVAYPMVGGDATKHSYNLKNPAANQISWTATVTHGSTGATGNGTSGFGDTGLNANTTTLTNLGFGVYCQDNSQTNITFAAFNSTSGAGAGFTPRYTDNNFYGAIRIGDGWTGGSVTDSRGLSVVSRTASNSLKAYIRGTQTGTTQTGSSGAAVSANFLLFKYATTTPSFTGRTFSFVFVSVGLSAADVSSITTLINDCQSTLGRAVP